MNTFQLSCFLAVADTLSFARAAETMNITQPAVTHQIQALESELQVKLFRRTTRLVELTDAGHLFLEDARGILGISIRARNRFAHPSETQPQRFAIGCFSYSLMFMMAPALKELAVSFPQLHPALRLLPLSQLMRLLKEEELDVVLGFQETEEKKTPCRYKELAKAPVVCICRPDHPLAGRPRLSMADLTCEKLILTFPNQTPSSITRLQGRLLGSRSPLDFHLCESPEEAAILVDSGFGVCVLPDLLAPPHSGLTLIPVDDAEPLSFGIYHEPLQDRPLLKAFLSCMDQISYQRISLASSSSSKPEPSPR